MLDFIPSYLCKVLIFHYFIAKRFARIYYYQETSIYYYLSFSSHRATQLD